MINLTTQERDKFATYLEQEAASDKSMMEQLAKLPGNYEAMKQKYNVESMAKLVVARQLRSIETETIGG